MSEPAPGLTPGPPAQAPAERPAILVDTGPHEGFGMGAAGPQAVNPFIAAGVEPKQAVPPTPPAAPPLPGQTSEQRAGVGDRG